MSAKICYVSMAFGIKHDAVSGRTVDYDRIYRELIVPAVQRAGLTSARADEFAGTLILKDICKAVITADVMLADVSSGNANVMYELGIRHALRRGATVLLTSTRLPFNLAQNYVLQYQLAADGGPEPGLLDAIITQLASVLRQKAEGAASDSPLYEYFPTLRIELPGDLQRPELRSRVYPAESQMAPSRGPDRKIAIERAEQIRLGFRLSHRRACNSFEYSFFQDESSDSSGATLLFFIFLIPQPGSGTGARCSRCVLATYSSG